MNPEPSFFDIDVIPALQAFLRDNKSIIDLGLAVSGQKLVEVYDFEPLNIDVGMYPCITLGEVSFRKAWVAAPNHLEVAYEVPINGYILHDDNAINARAIRAFLAAVSHLFESPLNQEIVVPNRTYTIHYHSEPPLDEGSIDYALIGDAFLRSFSAKWHGYITRTTHWQEG